MKISLLVTCLGDVFRPGAGKSVVRILRRLGHEVDFPIEQTCCGQPLYNSGFHDLSAEQAKHTIQVFERTEGPIVCPSGSCAAMVKAEYPRLFDAESGWRKRAEDLANRVFEFSDFVVNELKVTDVGARYEGKVAYHYACHLRMLDTRDAAQTLIRNIKGAEYVDLARQDQCCGFGGSFAIRYPEISGNLVSDKANCILATESRVVVSTDTGCLMNIGGRLHRIKANVEAIHLAELLERR